MAKLHVDYKKHIVTNPGILVGKPVVKGTRVPVETVLAYLADNPNVDELLLAFPRLTVDDVRACLDFAAEQVRAVAAS